MPRRARLNFKNIGLFICVCALLFGCAPPPTQTQKIEGITTLVPSGKAIIKARVQSTLNDYNTALEKHDKTLFMSGVDQGNQAVKGLFSAFFDDIESAGFPNTAELGMTLIDIEPINQDLVLAHIRRNRDGWQADWFFRGSSGKWVISEPTKTEAGAPLTTIFGNYTVMTYPIADDLNGKILPLIAKAQERLLEDLGETPAGKVKITVYPSVSISPLGGDALSGWSINPSEDGPDNIDIMSPTSWSFGFYDPGVGWESDFERLLTLELARITYVRNFGNPGQGADWFFEGLVEYVAGSNEMPEVIAAVRNDTITPIIDTSSADKKIDLAHFENLNNLRLAYGLSKSLVTFIVEQYGGMEAFWALARAYDRYQDMDQALQASLGIGYEQFDTSWREWLKEDYIKK
jgi:hypothetical protein